MTNGQLSQIAAPFRLGNVRAYPALQGFQVAILQRLQGSFHLLYFHLTSLPQQNLGQQRALAGIGKRCQGLQSTALAQ